MRKPILLTAALLLAALTAQAQVAAPTLAPLVRTSTSTNPAVLQWGAPSHVGIAYGRGDTKAEDDTGFQFGEGDADLAMAQLRWVGERFSLGAEYYSTSEQHDTKAPLPPGPIIDIDTSGAQVALAGQLGDMVALGLGYETSEFKFTTATDSGTTKGKLPVGGVSVRMGEVFFLGAAYGKETIDPAFTDSNQDRGVVRYGVGYRQAFGSGAVHLEAFREDRDPYDDPNNPPDTVDEVELTGYAVEAMFGEVLLSHVAFSQDSTDVQGGVSSTLQFDSTQSTVGWVPEAGWAVMAKLDTNEITQSTGEVFSSRIVSLGAALRF